MRSLTASGPFESLLFYYDLTLEPGHFFFLKVEGGRWELGGGKLFVSLNLLIIISYISKV